MLLLLLLCEPPAVSAYVIPPRAPALGAATGHRLRSPCMRAPPPPPPRNKAVWLERLTQPSEEEMEKKEKTIKQRKAAIKALRMWAELARTKQAYREDEAAYAQQQAALAEQQAAIAERQVQNAPIDDAERGILLDLVDTYRELVVVKSRLAVAEAKASVKRALGLDR
jgi:predicted acylesterase/phospholipase RssA